MGNRIRSRSARCCFRACFVDEEEPEQPSKYEVAASISEHSNAEAIEYDAVDPRPRTFKRLLAPFGDLGPFQSFLGFGEVCNPVEAIEDALRKSRCKSPPIDAKELSGVPSISYLSSLLEGAVDGGVKLGVEPLNGVARLVYLAASNEDISPGGAKVSLDQRHGGVHQERATSIEIPTASKQTSASALRVAFCSLNINSRSKCRCTKCEPQGGHFAYRSQAISWGRAELEPHNPACVGMWPTRKSSSFSFFAKRSGCWLNVPTALRSFYEERPWSLGFRVP